jgi:hypothetical protein
MSKAGAMDLASGLGGKIEKSEVLSAVDKYDVSLTLCLSSVVIVERQTNLFLCLSE